MTKEDIKRERERDRKKEKLRKKDNEMKVRKDSGSKGKEIAIKDGPYI